LRISKISLHQSNAAEKKKKRKKKKRKREENTHRDRRRVKKRSGNHHEGAPNESTPTLQMALSAEHAREHSDLIDPRTTARRHFANALVELVGHEHIALHIDGHAMGKAEAGVGPGPVAISAIGSTDPAHKRQNRCVLTGQNTAIILTKRTATQHINTTTTSPSISQVMSCSRVLQKTSVVE
jgi:hypothetical protein